MTQEPTVRSQFVLYSLGIVAILGLTPQSSEAQLGSYVALKGGIYSPSTTFDLGNVDLETTLDGDTRTGVNAEFAFGHYVLPSLILEGGIGYFKGRGSFDASNSPRRDLSFDVVPLTLTAKGLIPVGQVDPYGELGIGAYFTSFDVDGNANSFSGTTTFGMHAGAGVNVPVSPQVFIGLEGRYVAANPSFGDQKIKLNDTEYSLNKFDLNGFTTTLGVGYSF
jgi:opacity protein-like surface antigen